MKIYKYQPDEVGIIELPQNHQILSIQLQNNKPTLWAAVEEESETTTLKFYAVPTGFGITPSELKNYQTTLLGDNGLVWHIFMEK